MDKSIDEIIESFDVTKKSKESKETRVLSLVVPVEYKTRFDRLQFESDKEFGELLKKIIMQTIDRVDRPA